MILFLLLLAAFLCYNIINNLYYVHMFQLNGYKPKVQRAWLAKRLPPILGRCLLILFGLVFVPFFPVGGKIVSILCFLLSAYLCRPRKAKKPLVYTARVKRLLCTDGILWVLICVFLFFFRNLLPLAAVLLAAASFFAPWILLFANFINRPMETGINNHYINDAKRLIRQSPSLQVIGITGSYGKTSVKYFLQTLLSTVCDSLMTPESYNTTLGVVRTVREQLHPTHEYFVCEMGARNIGDIREICDIVLPSYGILTAIGPQHLESFRSIENIVKTKFELIDSLGDRGTAFLNYDNEWIRNRPVSCKTVSYGIEYQNADYFGTDISVSKNGTSFRVIHKGESMPFFTSLIGAHNVQNLVGAIAAAHTLGVPVKELQMGVRQIQSVPHRLELTRRQGITIIDDAYNSNPTGAKAALDTLSCFDGVRIVITPGMVELGEKEEECNFTFGRQMAKVCDYAILIGGDRTVPIQNGLIQEGFPKEKLFVYRQFAEGIQRAYALPSGQKEKVILLENDLPDNY